MSLRGWQRLKWLLAQEGPVKVIWDATMVLAALRERAVVVEGPLEDPKVAVALLGQQAQQQQEKKKKTRAAAAAAGGPLRFNGLPMDQQQVVEFVGFQASGLLQLGAAVEEALVFTQLLDPFRLIEMPLVPVLAEMQFYGMRVDRGWFPGVVLAIQERLLLLQDLADAFGGCHLNLNCADAVHHLLYIALRLKPPPHWSKKTNVFVGGRNNEGSKTLLGPVQTEWLESMVDVSPAVKGTTLVDRIVCVCF